MDELLTAAAFGLAGAFVYAAPRLSACWVSPKDDGESRGACAFEFACALIIGAIGAAAVGPWIADWRHMTQPRDLNAICVIIGLVANPSAPVLINLAPRMISTILASLKGPKTDES